MSIFKQVKIDLNPEELAEVFCEMWAEEQAAFFARVAQIAAEWPGAGMCVQALSIASHLTPEGRYVIERLADHAGLIHNGDA